MFYFQSLEIQPLLQCCVVFHNDEGRMEVCCRQEGGGGGGKGGGRGGGGGDELNLLHNKQEGDLPRALLRCQGDQHHH